jgi:hypothetical protein
LDWVVLLAGVFGGVEDPWLGVSLSAKASWMKENFADQLGQSSSHSVNKAAKPLRRDFSWS